MASIGDMKSFILQLKYTNYAEGLDRNPRHHVRQISFCVSILEQDVAGTDAITDTGRPWTAEDQEALKWQPKSGKWQNDFEVRDNLTYLSGKLCQGLCPGNNLEFSLFGKVSDSDTRETRTDPPQSLSSYRHVSFYSVMLTKHSVSNKQDVQLLFSADGLPKDRSCLRWRSHDYIKLELSDAKPFYTVFWLVRWDVVDMTDSIDTGLVATGPAGTVLGMNHSRPSSDPSTSERQGGDLRKFLGVRFRQTRKSPWSAEVRPRGSKNKISVGCYQTSAEAARAVDAGRYYYNRIVDKLNFPDSARILEKVAVPPNLSEEAWKAFVFEQAHQLSRLAEKPPPWIGISEIRSWNSNPGGFSSRSITSPNNCGAHNMRPVTNVRFAGLPDGFATTSMDSGTGLLANLVDVRPSTSFGSRVLRESVARSSPEESRLESTPNRRFASNLQVSAAGFHPQLVPTYTHEASFAPVRNSMSGETTNDGFNVLDTDWAENLEQDIPATIRVSENLSVGVSHSNHSSLHHEIQSQPTMSPSPGYDLNPLAAGSEQAGFGGDYSEEDLYIFDLDGFF